MADELKETVESEVEDALKRGSTEATPFILQAGVFMVVGAVVAVVAGIALLVYFLA
ncbi:MAG: hypothetical protein ABR521_06460 [Gaiellaceae bacterium]